MPETYYIDGYNVIHHCGVLKSLAGHDFEAARDALVDRVSRYCSLTGKRARVVFDGRGRRHDPVRPRCGTPGMEVVFAARHQSADAYIERQVHLSQRRGDLTVVSADRGIRDMCIGLGAMVMHPESFLAMVGESESSLTRNLGRKQTQDHMPRLGDRLEPGAAEKLRNLRGRLGPKPPRQG